MVEGFMVKVISFQKLSIMLPEFSNIKEDCGLELPANDLYSFCRWFSHQLVYLAHNWLKKLL